jgi:tetratricopeptide (TPR) repeat protein
LYGAVHRRFVSRWLAPLAVSIALVGVVRADDADSVLAAGLAKLSAGDYASAAEKLADAVAKKQLQIDRLLAGVDAPPDSQTLARENESLRQAMIGAGSALRRLGRSAEALEFFEAALDSVSAAGQANEPRWSTIELAAAQCAAQQNQLDKAVALCQRILDRNRDTAAGTPVTLAAEGIWIECTASQGDCDAAWSRFSARYADPSQYPDSWRGLAHHIGLTALARNQAVTSQAAFRWFLQHADQASAEDREIASLGIAWAAAQGAESYAVAADRLQEFVTTYPNSSQIPRALLVRAGCLERAEQKHQAREAYVQLIHQFPDSVEAATAIGDAYRLASDQPLPPTAPQILMRALSQQSVDGPAVEAALMLASDRNDAALWQLAVNRLPDVPAVQSSIGRILRQLDTAGRSGDAEQLATFLLGSTPSGGPAPDAGSAIDEVCRWATTRQQWQMLSLAGESAIRENRLEQLSDISLRLMAEGAMQTATIDVAAPLFDHLIESRGNRDFDTLLRRAEIALSVDSKERAADAIEKAAAAVSSASQECLVTMLRAQVAIRSARMPEARDLLDQIVRDHGSPDGIKARAQWLIGETYFLQRQYDRAIDHYRLVEALDPTGQWTVVALVQAGRAFEQLDRRREAAVCYTSLMTRFADSPHVPAARERLAALGSATEEPAARREILR